MFRTVFNWIAIIFYTVLFGTIGLLLSFTSSDKGFKYAIRPWGRSILNACGVKVDVEGVENLPKEPSIIMYNHQSSADIFAFSGFLPVEWRGVLKKELAKVPFVGWVTKAMGHYFVERDGSGRDTQEIRRMVEKIRSGPSVLIAPEGTRSPDGSLLPFKKGGFVVAMYAKVPVVPMVIIGGKEVMPKGSMKINPGSMKMKILPPIEVKNLPSGREGREELMRLVREVMERALQQEEGRMRVAL
jgi:1-acyl-sn-glycerol-3-phosphate acyltransferase